MEFLKPEAKAAFFPCKSCSNIMTKECFDACMPELRFDYYKHRPGTDIQQLLPFPIEEVLQEPDPYKRLLSICIYLTSAIDFIQHSDEYQRNREVYKEAKNGQNIDRQRSGRLSSDIESQDLYVNQSQSTPSHQDISERKSERK